MDGDDRAPEPLVRRTRSRDLRHLLWVVREAEHGRTLLHRRLEAVPLAQHKERTQVREVAELDELRVAVGASFPLHVSSTQTRSTHNQVLRCTEEIIRLRVLERLQQQKLELVSVNERLVRCRREGALNDAAADLRLVLMVSYAVCCDSSRS